MTTDSVANTLNTPNNLPLLRSVIIGRTRELATARDVLLHDEVGLLTLTGTGDVGSWRPRYAPNGTPPMLASPFNRPPIFSPVSLVGVYFIDLAHAPTLAIV